jgi:hypothetical protein
MGGTKMKNLFRIAALILVLAQLFVISAAAGEVPASYVEQMKAAVNGTEVKASGAAEGSAAAVNAENEKKAKEAEAAAEAAAAAKKAAEESVNYEIAPATDLGTAGDVMIGGLAIHPGVWYTVKDGVLTSSAPWPDSYLYYSASQSKITLHEFHYRVSGQTSGKEDTFAALYIPKDMHIILEGENELINGSFTKAGGGMSNGVYAPNCVITFEGDGVLKVNTLVDESLKGYGIGAGNIRIDSKFTGLAVFGMTSAFSSAPSIQGSHKMLANVANLHPEYYGDVRVKEASPYDKSIFTRFRYVLLAVGDEISPQQEMREQIEAEYYRSKMEYNEAVESGYAEAFETYNNEVSNSLMEFGMAMDQEMNAINSQEFSFDAGSWEENTAGSQLLDMLMGAVG